MAWAQTPLLSIITQSVIYTITIQNAQHKHNSLHVATVVFTTDLY